MADLEKIAEDLSSLTVIEAAELATMLEEKWGVSAAAPVAIAAIAGAGGGEAAAAEEQDEFDVVEAQIVVAADVLNGMAERIDELSKLIGGETD